MKKHTTTADSQSEFIGQIIDIFEDFLDEKGITINNSSESDPNTNETVHITGTDYDHLKAKLEDTINNWNTTNKGD